MKRREFFAFLGGAICAPFGARLLRERDAGPDVITFKSTPVSDYKLDGCATVTWQQWRECKWDMGEIDSEALRDYEKACARMLRDGEEKRG
jgi:hypothetical protein